MSTGKKEAAQILFFLFEDALLQFEYTCLLSHPHRDRAWPHFSIRKTSNVLVSRSSPAAGPTAHKDMTAYPKLGTERALPSHASRDLPFQQALDTLDVRGWFAATDVKTRPHPHPKTSTFRVSDNLKPHFQGGGVEICRTKVFQNKNSASANISDAGVVLGIIHRHGM